MKTQTGSSYVALIFLETRCYMRGVWPLPRSGRFTPRKEILYPFYRRLGGPQGRTGQVRKISPPPGFDPRTAQPVGSGYIDCATYLSVTWPKSIQSMPSNLLFLRSLKTSYINLRLGYPSCPFPSCLPTEKLYAFLLPSFPSHVQPASSVFIYSP